MIPDIASFHNRWTIESYEIPEYAEVVATTGTIYWVPIHIKDQKRIDNQL
ncbi:MAG: hypothetical protein ABUL44_02550 [Flavobacterium sp.]